MLTQIYLLLRHPIITFSPNLNLIPYIHVKNMPGTPALPVYCR